MRDLLAPEKGVLIQGGTDRQGIRDLYIPDIRKITGTLGVKIRYPLDDAISNTVQSNLSAAK